MLPPKKLAITIAGETLRSVNVLQSRLIDEHHENHVTARKSEVVITTNQDVSAFMSGSGRGYMFSACCI